MSGSWWLEVETPGPHWLDADWLRAQGIDPALMPAQVQLSLAGQPVPYLLLEGPDGAGLLFNAVDAPTRYASWTAYRLDVGQGAGQVMDTAPLTATVRLAETDPAPAGAAVQDTAWATRWQEEDLRYLPQIKAPEPWFWEPIFSQGRITRTMALSEAVAGPVTVTVRLWNQGLVPGGAHAPQIWWDVPESRPNGGEPLGTWQWDGPAEQNWPAEWTGATGPDGHKLVLELPGGADAPIQKVWLDGWGVTFRRPLIMNTPGITWTAEVEAAVVAGSEGARLLDVGDPAAPLDRGVVKDEPIPTQPGHRYWLGIPWQAPAPARTRPLTAIDRAALEQADYLVVAPGPFWQALQPLVEHRRGQGLNLALVTPEQVYDAFGDGRPDPEALRALVQRLHGQGQLRYLLLVGDASPRPDGYAGAEGALRVVTALVPTASLHETPSDQALVIDDEGQPLVAVGRFPAQTAAQLEAMVDKTLRWEKEGVASTLLLTDDQSSFAGFADEILPHLPAAPQRLDTAQDDARSNALAQLQEQGTWLNYIGHGSLALWGDEKVLQREDEWDEPAVVTVWACLSAYFVHPQQDSLAEVWLRSPRGGAVAFLGPTGETYLSQQKPIALAFYREVQAGQTIGEALLAGWLSANDFEQDAVRSFLLLGDPALRLQPPDGGGSEEGP